MVKIKVQRIASLSIRANDAAHQTTFAHGNTESLKFALRGAGWCNPDADKEQEDNSEWTNISQEVSKTMRGDVRIRKINWPGYTWFVGTNSGLCRKVSPGQTERLFRAASNCAWFPSKRTLSPI